jgi:hypothetical protein
VKIKAYYYIPIEGTNALELVMRQFDNVKSISENDGKYNIVTDRQRMIFEIKEVKLEIL